MYINTNTFWLCNIPGEDRMLETGVWSASYIYEQMQRQDRVRFFFYDDALHTLDKFKAWVKDEHNWFYALYRCGTQDLFAFAVVNTHMGRTALLHYCIMDEGLPYGEAIARSFLKEASKTKECLIGITPKPFRHAWQFSVRAGGKRIAELPGACYLARQDKYVPAIVTQFLL